MVMTNNDMSEEPKTVCGLLDKLACDFCNNYCKYEEQFRKAADPDEENLYREHCANCPLNDLGL